MDIITITNGEYKIELNRKLVRGYSFFDALFDVSNDDIINVNISNDFLKLFEIFLISNSIFVSQIPYETIIEYINYADLFGCNDLIKKLIPSILTFEYKTLLESQNMTKHITNILTANEIKTLINISMNKLRIFNNFDIEHFDRLKMIFLYNNVERAKILLKSIEHKIINIDFKFFRLILAIIGNYYQNILFNYLKSNYIVVNELLDYLYESIHNNEINCIIVDFLLRVDNKSIIEYIFDNKRHLFDVYIDKSENSRIIFRKIKNVESNNFLIKFYDNYKNKFHNHNVMEDICITDYGEKYDKYNYERFLLYLMNDHQ